MKKTEDAFNPSSNKLNKRKKASIFMALLPLSACGGGGGGSSTPEDDTPVPSPAPAEPAEFIESPTDTWVARDSRDTVLEQSAATTNLTVMGKDGDDIIHTGSGDDTIDSSGGNDIIRPGTGADTVNAGSGNDAIVLVGTTTANQYEQTDINNAGNGYDLSDVITLADLNGRSISEVMPGEVIDGGSGVNTLFIYGTVDLTGVTLSNVTILEIHSTVVLTPEQLAQFTTVNGDGTSTINIEVPSGDDYVLDLSSMDMADIASINIDGDLTVKISDSSNLVGVTTITSTNTSRITLDIVDDGTDTTVSLADINDTFETVDEIVLDNQVTLEVTNATDVTGLQLLDISGDGTIDTNGNSDIQEAIDDNVTVEPTILENPAIIINDVTRNEIDETATFTVTLSHAYDQIITVDYEAPDGRTGTLTFNPGETEKTFTTSWTDDDIIESNLTQQATLSNSNNASITKDFGELTILDDDAIIFSDGTLLTSLSLSSNELIRGEDGIELGFKVDGDPVTVFVEITNNPWDPVGGDVVRTYNYTGIAGTVNLPLSGIDFRYQPTASSYTIEAYHISNIYFEDSKGNRTYLMDQDLNKFSLNDKITVYPEKNNDTTLPELVNFEILTDEANLDVYGRPKIFIEAQDHETGISAIRIYALNDAGYEVVVFYSPNDKGINATTVSKWYSSHYEITRIEITNDNISGAKQTITYSAEQLRAMGFITEFDVSATREYPVVNNSISLVDFSISTSTIDLTSSQIIEISFISEEPSLTSISVWLEDENNNTILVEGASYIGSGIITLHLPDGIEAGIVHIGKVQISSFGNQVEYSQSDLNALGFSTTIELIGTPPESVRDTTPPEVYSLEIHDNVINIDEGEIYIPVTSEVYDESRNPSVYARYVTEDGRYLLVSFSENNTSGSIIDLDLAADIYYLLDVRVSDNEGNSDTITGTRLNDLGLPSSIEVINNLSDTEPSNLTHFNFVDDYIDLTSGENQIQIEYTATDNFSGVLSLYISLRGPNGEKYQFYTYGEDGIFSITLPEDAASGIYTVYQVRTKDQTQSPFNIKRYLSYDEDYSAYNFDEPIEYFQDLGFETSFEVSNDFPEPELELLSFELSYTSLSLEDIKNTQQIEFSTNHSDGLISGMLVKFIDSQGLLHSNYYNGSSGVVEFSLVSDIATNGTYALHSVTLYDINNNYTEYDITDIQNLFGEINTTFEVTNSKFTEITLPENSPYTYLPIVSVSPTNDPLIDGILEGVKYQLNEDGSPLIITYSFVDPEVSIFDQATAYSHSDANYEDAHLITALNGEEQKVVRKIFDELEEFLNIIFVEVEDSGETSAGHIRFSWTSGWLETGIIDSSSGWTTYPSNSAKAGDIWLSSNLLTNTIEKNEDIAVLKQTLIHEIGHALGLGHPFEDNDTFPSLPLEYDGKDYTAMAYMNKAGAYTNSSGIAPDHFMWLDIQALQYLYGANENSTAGDDIYSFHFIDTNYLTIWDFDGTDTIDASNITENIMVDLNPGNWSNIGTVFYYKDTVLVEQYKSKTIFIAPDTIIENAIGGSGDDILISNSANNELTGNAGSDTFKFLDDWGDDTILDFTDGEDVLDFSETSLAEDDITITQIDEDTVITDGVNTITLVDFESTDITQVDYLFA